MDTQSGWKCFQHPDPNIYVIFMAAFNWALKPQTNETWLRVRSIVK